MSWLLSEVSSIPLPVVRDWLLLEEKQETNLTLKERDEFNATAYKKEILTNKA